MATVIDTATVFVESGLRLSTPLMIAALAGLVSERSGLANIALEAKMLVTAFFAAAVTTVFLSPALGVLAGVLSGAVFGGLFGLVCIWGRADHIVVGTAMNLLAVGLTPTLCRFFFDSTGNTPPLDRGLRIELDWIFLALAVALAFLLQERLAQSRWGLRLKACGDQPEALRVQGIDPKWIRFKAAMISGAICGLGGVVLSLVQGSGFIRDMSSGRGFIALAALIFGRWKPLPTLFAALVFGFADAGQMLLQGQTWGRVSIPNSLVQIVPFVFTLALLVGRGLKSNANRIDSGLPRAINTPL